MASDSRTSENVPVLDKEGEEWVLKVDGAAPVRIPYAQRGLANSIWQAAQRAYINGRLDVEQAMRRAMGITT